jgi:hypothetical protein
VGLPAPKVAIKIRILTQRLFVHWSMMGAPDGHLEMSSL